ncbi:MAG: LysM peptidoglycan-binding domain-containing protein, partial [Phototrophicaceae bacterium]
DMVRLVRIDGRYHRPPICTLKWGKMSWGSKLPFKCVLISLTIDYKMFLADGTPVRAEAVCSFQQWRDAKEDQQSVDKKSPDVFKVHVVKRGETLSSIAYQHFNSPSYWRFIATANKITNPHRLEPGRVLTIPALKPEER